MTFAPPTLLDLAAFLETQEAVNLGIVGDANHASGGTSYHLGRDQLSAGAYSDRTLRDRRGLTNAASAIDIGRIGGSLDNLRTFSKWLVTQARRDAAGTADMREIIYSPDGATVLRWDRERGFESAPLPGEADNSHLTHTHISWYRDAEFRDHRTAFRPFPWETVMAEITVEFVAPAPFDVIDPNADGTASWAASADHALQTRVKGRVLVDATVVIPSGTPHGKFLRIVTGATGRRLIVATEARPAPATAPADCSAEIAAAITADRAKARIVYP